VEAAKSAEPTAGDAEGSVAGGKAVVAATAMSAATISSAGRGFAVVWLSGRFLAAPLFAGNEPVVFVQNAGGADQGEAAAKKC
jgi:hypothetical protein